MCEHHPRRKSDTYKIFIHPSLHEVGGEFKSPQTWGHKNYRPRWFFPGSITWNNWCIIPSPLLQTLGTETQKDRCYVEKPSSREVTIIIIIFIFVKFFNNSVISFWLLRSSMSLDELWLVASKKQNIPLDYERYTLIIILVRLNNLFSLKFKPKGCLLVDLKKLGPRRPVLIFTDQISMVFYDLSEEHCSTVSY